MFCKHLQNAWHFLVDSDEKVTFSKSYALIGNAKTLGVQVCLKKQSNWWILNNMLYKAFLVDWGFINFFICTWAYLSVRIQVPKEQNKNMAKQGKLDHRHFLLSNSWTGNLLGNLLGKVQKAVALWKIHRDIIILRLTDTSFPPCYAQIELYTWNLIVVGSAKTTIEEGKTQ